MGHRGVCGVESVNISQTFATKTEEKLWFQTMNKAGAFQLQ